MVKPVVKMSEYFGNAIIVKKGLVDIVTDGKEAFYVASEGSKKRCGGIGDILAGTIGSFVQFAPSRSLEPVSSSLGVSSLAMCDSSLFGVVMACISVREASNKAWKKKGHALVAPDIIDELSSSISEATEL